MKRKVSLRFDVDTNRWILRNDQTQKTVKAFDSKEGGTKAGVLRKVLGRQGGTVVIRTKTGTLDEERNFPREG